MVKLTSNWNFKFFIHPIEICKDIYTLPRKNDYSFCTYLPLCGFNSFSLSSDISARKTLLFEKYFCNFTLHSLKVLKHNFKSRQIGNNELHCTNIKTNNGNISRNAPNYIMRQQNNLECMSLY